MYDSIIGGEDVMYVMIAVCTAVSWCTDVTIAVCSAVSLVYICH